MFRKPSIRRKDTFTSSYNSSNRFGNVRPLAESIRNVRGRSDSQDYNCFVKNIHIQK
jgi:hypothetical protein